MLHHFSKKVLLPSAVWQELERLETKGFDISELRKSDWLVVVEVGNTELVSMLQAELDKGESEAIALAMEKGADYLLIDEKDGRAKASALGVQTIGTIGIFIALKENEIIPAIKPYLDSLRNEAGFYLSDKFYQEILKKVGE
ncbi:MAG: DUF3368 domain-containing protein [Saprospiraceae bacterium]|nr:DUF3368 domain-containing protein [Saprospiraceae bacterium]